MRTLFLERPSFWTDTRDGEAWFRALAALQSADSALLTGSPRSVWGRVLSKSLSRRTALGLFGATNTAESGLLHGVGLIVERDAKWVFDPEAAGLLSQWERHAPETLKSFAAFLIHNSVWLRCLLCRLLDGHWELADWPRVRSARRGLTPGESLLLRHFAEPPRWLEGIEQRAGSHWLQRTGCDTLAVHHDVLGRSSRRDDLSLAPLTAPLHLLETVGWMSPQGVLQLPAALVADLVGHLSPARTLSDLTARNADMRGFVAIEPVLRELLAAFGAQPRDDAFVRWMDALLERAVSAGALEILAGEPGQARHGRGLFGDPTRKLVRWVVHEEFNGLFEGAWSALETGRDAQRNTSKLSSEGLTQ